MNIDEIIQGSRRPVVIAHRGASFYFRENTFEAFEAAVDMRAEMVELDVHRTKDGILVVHHDPYIAEKPISGLTLKELKERSAKNGYDVPTLLEVLEHSREKLFLDIELKEAGYEDHVLETVLGVLGPEQFLISSGHDKVILKIKTLRPEIRTGLVLYRASFPRFLSHLFPAGRVKLTGADILVVSKQLLKLGFLRFNSRLGKPAWVYTVNDRQQLWKYINDERIGGIFTDRPDVGLFLRDLYAVGRYQESGDKSQESE